MLARDFWIGILLVASMMGRSTAAAQSSSYFLQTAPISFRGIPQNASAAMAAVLYGAVAGTITDSVGRPVSGARVLLTNQANGLKRVTVTDNQGHYSISEVQPGVHDLQVALDERLKPFLREDIEVARGAVTRIDARLEPGSPSSPPIPPIAQTNAKPFVALEKSQFLVGEQVFFWVGVSAGSIPESLCDTGRIRLTRPDGTERIDPSGCPIDGSRELGWQGGWTLGSELPALGRWTVVHEFAGHRSEPASFVVAHDAIVELLETRFEFSSSLLLDDPGAYAALVVRNRSPEVIRFPERGHSHFVSVQLNRSGGTPWTADFFVPEAALSAATGSSRTSLSASSFTWNTVGEVPVITVAPGQTYRLRLPLPAALDGLIRDEPIPAGEYEVRLFTLLQILVGSQHGPWDDSSPLRLEVTGTARAVRR
jgi:hypothetical protein